MNINSYDNDNSYFNYHSGSDMRLAIADIMEEEKKKENHDGKKLKEGENEDDEGNQAIEEFLDDKPNFEPGEVKEKDNDNKKNKNLTKNKPN